MASITRQGMIAWLIILALYNCSCCVIVKTNFQSFTLYIAKQKGSVIEVGMSHAYVAKCLKEHYIGSSAQRILALKFLNF